MTLPARNSLAVIGAGPIGLEAASAALDRGFDVHVFERGEVGDHVLAWGHVPLFTPWRMNLGPSGRVRLEAQGWTAPDPASMPTGSELVTRGLAPLAGLPGMRERIHTHTQIVHVSRRGCLKGDSIGADQRREFPFRLLARDAGGRESFLHAYSVIDASGVYGQPNWAGDGGIPARGELYLAPQMSYHVDDVRGLRRARHAGKRTLVIGGGASAATVVSDLLELANEAPGTSIAWATRRPASELYAPIRNDSLPARARLYEKARTLLGSADPRLIPITGVVVEGFEFNSATHRYRVTLRRVDDAAAPRIEEVDAVIVNTGFGPDDSIYRELQVHECYASRGPMKLAAALLDSGAADCVTVPAFGADVLANPEPDFFILGNKSYGRNPHFLLETGYRQVSDVIEKLARDQQVHAPA
ncbi:MAG TPA: NAD-binding protein [Candidatus Udaeobacter sp.]|jgi:thioredoxin reductase|nr:NAD-binding protein [Candidatus Udaeobacter sp.]